MPTRILRSFLSPLLAMVLAFPGAAAPPIQQRIVEIPDGAIVDVRLVSGEKLRGRLASADSDGVTVLCERNGALTQQRWTYPEIRDIHKVESRAKTFFAALGVVYTFLIVVTLAIAQGRA
jgi:hypothetical protein